MSSVLDQASSATPSTARDSENKLPKKWRANVWKLHYRLPREEETQHFIFCKYYPLDDKEVEPYGSDIATNMRGHLESHYEIIVLKDLSKN